MLLRRHHELGWNCFGFNVMLRHPEILYQLFPQNFPGKYLGRVLGKIHLKKNLLQTLVESLCPCIFIESIRRECTQHNHLTQNLHSLPSLSSNRIRERVRVPTVEIATHTQHCARPDSQVTHTALYHCSEAKMLVHEVRLHGLNIKRTFLGNLDV